MLSPRLAAIADMAAGGKRVIDVGTDHGYVPVYLACQGSWERVAASDINEGPLNAAIKNAEQSGMEKLIEFYKTDGLAGIDDGFDTVIISGMGGETICHILDECKWNFKSVRLVLQPQSKTELLESWLTKRCFKITDACLVKDDGRFYTVFMAEIAESGCSRVLDKLFEKKDKMLTEYIDSLIEKYKSALSGLTSANNPDEVRINELRALLNDAINAREAAHGKD